jgi:transglutaminase-like putative cysteine protease
VTGLRRLVGPLALYVAATIFAGWHLRHLEHPALPWLRLEVLAAVALAPALLALLAPQRLRIRAYVAAIVPTLVVAAGILTGHWPFRPHLFGHGGYFASVYRDVTDGLSSWVQVVLPYDPVTHPELRVVVSLAILGCFAALAAALLVIEAPLAGMLFAFVPFLVVSTVFALGGGSLRGGLMAGISLAILAVAATARGGRARIEQVVAVAGVAAVATALVAVPGVAKGQFLDWQHFHAKPQRGKSVGFVWNQTYGPLVRPKKPFTVLRVSSPISSYWRATALESFNGVAWNESPQTAAVGDAALQVPRGDLPDAVQSAKPVDHVKVRFQNVGLDTPYLVTATTATGVENVPDGVGRVSRSTASVFAIEHSTTVKQRWVADAVKPSATVKDLAPLTPDYSNDVRQQYLTLLSPDLVFPVFGAPDREKQVQQILDQRFYGAALGPWRDVYASARQITKQATRPYDAVALLESYFQTRFTYDEKADYSGAADPLPAFFFDPKHHGYCQMFSGTMAVMLRMLGIPARVVEGFTEGKLSSSGDYVVTDRDAHAWVEVYFPRFGWLPFEPTPTRSLPSTYSPSNGQGFRVQIQGLAALGIAGGLRALQEGATPGGPNRSTGRPGLREDVPAGFGVVSLNPGRRYHPGFVVVAGAILLGLVLVVVLAKRVRPLRVRLAREPHAIAAAVRSDLEAYVRDQGVRGPIAALTPLEFGSMLKREFGVNGADWAGAQARARYGPAAGAAQAARDARREARGLKRDMRRSLTRVDRVRGTLRPASLLPVRRDE